MRIVYKFSRMTNTISHLPSSYMYLQIYTYVGGRCEIVLVVLEYM